MDEGSGGNWSVEDFGGDDGLFGLDTQSLFRPGMPDPSLAGTTASETPSPLTAFSSVDSDVFDPVFPVDQELGLLDSGYISSNSSDSGNHSPNSTESYEQGVPWMFPEPVRHQQEQTRHTVKYPVKGNTPPALIYAASTPRHAQNGFYTQNVTPPPSVTPVTQKKVIYVVPTAVSTARPQAVPLTQFSIAQPAVITTAAPIYINRATGNRMQPISIAPSSSAQTYAIVGPDLEKDEMIRRNEDRKAKNRVAAQNSRIKKRNEMEDNKLVIHNLREENRRLTEENAQLRARLAKYEAPRTEGGGPSRKRMAAAGGLLMALFVMVTAGPFRIEDTPSPGLRIPPINNTRTVAMGRVLNPDVIISEMPVLNGTSCSNKKNYNSTETIRLNNDLYEWVDRHQTMGLGLKGAKRMLVQKKQKEWASAVGNVRVNVTDEQPETNRTTKEPVKKTKTGDRLWRHLDMISVSGGSAKERREKMKKMMKGGKDASNNKGYEKLTAAIQQKEDTLYVVALEDYFLLPALERNFTSQPRLTLILPALSLNSTVDGKVPLMRIDLRVVGTGLFNLSRQLLPLFLQ